ncbi:related to RCL1 - RNA terminal phosphate cyclase-like protein [Melanopsichium pennsylvanicum]|uniref:Related to RCL1 - RNA terminal phosphate cyclase-like protein n=2 Tax=Melanopsichium pennsylvanicum TaxID=63383 RepID=A0AAJ4XNQ8_9BASI|nr:related to RCL1-RNA terminal phosphate cyclase-like protein [Melanopsichium pennsylvanicum 4]SNX85151.1 related to RCL1 - RNA terminal phosphate cyclase-like protein [Melanopsichium pennsylvanicum]
MAPSASSSSSSALNGNNSDAKSRLLRFTGHRNFRQRLVLSLISQRPVRIDSIRPDSSSPGIRDFEANFLRLIEKVTNGSHVEISYTGTSVLLKPGVIAGGKVVHDCSLTRGIGYWLEWMVVLAPFAKKELNLVLGGITNMDGDLGVDTIRTVTLPHLSLFMPFDSLSTLASSLELRIAKRGSAPLGGGEIHFRCPIIKNLFTLNFTAPGRIKKIRGIATSTRVSPQMANRLIDSARGVLGRYIPDLYLFADVYRGEDSGKSPGFAITLLATSTTGAIYSAEAASKPTDPGLPEDLAQSAARQLLDEIATRGCVDRCHQPLVLLLMALSPQDVARCTMGSLTANAISMMRDIKHALGVSFKITPAQDLGIDANADQIDASNSGNNDDDQNHQQKKRENQVLNKIASPDQFAVSCVGIDFRGFKKVG